MQALTAVISQTVVVVPRPSHRGEDGEGQAVGEEGKCGMFENDTGVHRRDWKMVDEETGGREGIEAVGSKRDSEGVEGGQSTSRGGG